jgi:aquaporin Z
MKKYIAELFGTMALVLVGCGSAVIAGQYIGVMGVALAFGFTILALVYTIGPISGCHINPAVTLAMWINGRIDSKDSGYYIIAQIAGAIIGAAILLGIASGTAGYTRTGTGLSLNGFGENSPGGYSLLACFFAEVVFTFLFVLVVLGAMSKRAPKGFAGIAIGLGLAMVHLVSIPITGTSVNPARSIGPALVAALREWSVTPLAGLWLFILAPLAGSIFAAVLWKYVFETATPQPQEITSPDLPAGQ